MSAFPLVSFFVNGRPVGVALSPLTPLSTVLREHLGLRGTKLGCGAGDCGSCTVLLDAQPVLSCLIPLGQLEGCAVTTIEGIDQDLSEAKAKAKARTEAKTEAEARTEARTEADATSQALASAARALQRSLQAHGAVQCGFCMPAVVMAGAALLARTPQPSRAQALQALDGILCRCTGYIRLLEAILAAGQTGQGVGAAPLPSPPSGLAAAPLGGASHVGQARPRVDAEARLRGESRFADDAPPAEALWLRVVRSPHPHARFHLGDLEALRCAVPGLAAVLQAADIPGDNSHGVFPGFQDQPVLADGLVRYRGEAVLALVGTEAALAVLPDAALPITWEIRPALTTPEAAEAPGAPQLHPHAPGNVMLEAWLLHGPGSEGQDEQGEQNEQNGPDLVAEPRPVVTGEWRTGFVEHAYLEPEAGWAVWHPQGLEGVPAASAGAAGPAWALDSPSSSPSSPSSSGETPVLELVSTLQAPYMARDSLARILALEPNQIRIRPSACGGGFGGKLDLSLQPLLALAALRCGRPVRGLFSRGESMAATTKRHPAHIQARLSATSDGRLDRLDLEADFDTGAYASWGPAVAGRARIHATGPYRLRQASVRCRALHTHNPPGGAFRGFGVPQLALAVEGLMDRLAETLGVDPLELRLQNAYRPGDRSTSGQRLGASTALVPCLETLRPTWRDWRAQAESHNRAHDRAHATSGTWDDSASERRLGVGIGCAWYGIGNTGAANPSHMRLALYADGRVVLFNGAVDIGQGSDTVLQQIAADALGIAPEALTQVLGDTALTPDAGKTSASRQTYVSGEAVRRAAQALRADLLPRINAGPDARLVAQPGGGLAVVEEEGPPRALDFTAWPPQAADGAVLEGIGVFDPPIKPLDANGQGEPYAAYAYGAQIALVSVDTALGLVRVLEIQAAHDVGRAINPLLAKAQIEGGIAQGLGLALLEAYEPGRSENLHDYLLPMAADMPQMTVHLIESAPDPLGPYGAKGLGEPALIPTAPAILSAIRHACGVTLDQIPVQPHRLRQALRRHKSPG